VGSQGLGGRNSDGSARIAGPGANGAVTISWD
jgi:hypothetical protein